MKKNDSKKKENSWKKKIVCVSFAISYAKKRLNDDTVFHSIWPYGRIK
jgi:hypothetical protein